MTDIASDFTFTSEICSHSLLFCLFQLLIPEIQFTNKVWNTLKVVVFCCCMLLLFKHSIQGFLKVVSHGATATNCEMKSMSLSRRVNTPPWEQCNPLLTSIVVAVAACVRVLINRKKLSCRKKVQSVQLE